MFTADTPSGEPRETEDQITPDPHRSDTSGANNASLPNSNEPECRVLEGDEDMDYEWTDEDGTTYLLRHKRPVSGRNQPGKCLPLREDPYRTSKVLKTENHLQKEKGSSHSHVYGVAQVITIGDSVLSPFKQSFPWQKGKGNPIIGKGKGKSGKPGGGTWFTQNSDREEDMWAAPPPSDVPITPWEERTSSVQYQTQLPVISEIPDYENDATGLDSRNDRYQSYGEGSLFPVFSQDI